MTIFVLACTCFWRSVFMSLHSCMCMCMCMDQVHKKGRKGCLEAVPVGPRINGHARARLPGKEARTQACMQAGRQAGMLAGRHAGRQARRQAGKDARRLAGM